jgi:hypothetical protein
MKMRAAGLGLCLVGGLLFTGGEAAALTPTPSPTPTRTPTPVPPPTFPPVEIPLGAANVAASTADGTNVAANTVDNNLGTRWSGFGDGAWIRFDIGAPRTVSQVKIAVYQGNQRRNRFDLQVSEDGATWFPVFSGQSSGTTTAEELYDVTDRRARFVRYLGHGSSTNSWNSLTEVSVFTPGAAMPACSVFPSSTSALPGETLIVTGQCANLGIPQYRLTVMDGAVEQDQANPIFTPARPAPIQVPSGSVSWTLTAARAGRVTFRLNANGEIFDPACGCFHFVNVGATSSPVTVGSPDVEITPPAARVSASGADGTNVAANVVDNDAATRWSAEGDGQWLELDLGAVQTVASVSLAVYRGNERRNLFDLQVAGEDRAWSTVWTGQSVLTAAEQAYEFPDQPARYIRYVGHGNTDPAKATWNSVTEMSVFGH